jgi:hypothetical protein
MGGLLRNGAVVVTILSGICGCSGNNRTWSPTAATAPAPSAPLGAPSALPGTSSTAIPLSLGQTVSGSVTLSDPTCDPLSTDPPEPCQRFAIAIPTSGVLQVQLTTRGPYSFTLGIGPSIRQWGTTVAASVQAGSTYEISVALHGRIEGIPSQTFELTTSLGPR